MRKAVTVVFLAAMVSGCSGAKLKSEWKEQRGYSQADIDTIWENVKEYDREGASAELSTNAFNTAPEHEFEGRMKTLICACYKKVGKQCRQKSDGLTGDQKSIWVKSNAADMALISRKTALDAKPDRVVDFDECP